MKKLIMIIAVAMVAVSYAKSRRDLGFQALRAAAEAQRRAQLLQSPERSNVTANPAQPAAAEVNSTPAAAKPTSISEMSDDKEFFEAFKKAGKTDDKSILKRARSMKDEKLLAEFVRLYPAQAKELAEERYYGIKSSELAEAIIDNVQGMSLSSYYRGWNQIPGLDDIVHKLASRLEPNTRAKYLAQATKNREKAAKDGVLVLEKFYIGMPVIDYVMISFEDKLSWTKEDGAVIDWLDHRADMKSSIEGKDWRTEWKIKNLSFVGKERYKYFKVKGTVDGLLEFAKKYMDKSASRKDITINGGWWQYTDEEHELKAQMNDDNGALFIEGI